MDSNRLGNSTCSNGTAIDSSNSIILGSVSCIALVLCLAAVTSMLCLKLYRQLLYRLAAYQVFGSMLHSLFSALQLIFLDYNEAMHSACVVIGYLVQVSQSIKLLFSIWITFHLFCFAVLYKNMKKLEPMYVLTSVLIPVVFSLIPFITNSYGLIGDQNWCWIQSKRCRSPYQSGFIEQIAVWYGPLLVALILESSAMLIILATVYYRAHKKMDDSTVFGREVNKKAFNQLLPLVAYPIAFLIFVIPPLVSRVYIFSINDSAVNPHLTTLIAICIPLWNLSTAATLFIHIAVAEFYSRRPTYRSPVGGGTSYNAIQKDELTSKDKSDTYVNSNTSFVMVADSVAD